MNKLHIILLKKLTLLYSNLHKTMNDDEKD
jgi:hypothetical protein